MFKQGNTKGNRFSSTNQPKKNGRKPALYTQLLKMVGKKVTLDLSREDFNKINQWVLERNKAELQAIMLNPDTPAFMLSLISAIVSDIKNGKNAAVEAIFDRVYGRARQTTDITTNGKEIGAQSVDLSSLSDQELAVIGEILKKQKPASGETQDEEDQ